MLRILNSSCVLHLFRSLQHSVVSRDRSGVGHAPVKRRKLISNANLAGGGGGPSLMRQGSCGGPPVSGSAAPRPALGVTGGAPRHYRSSVPGVKVGGAVVSSCQALDRDRTGLAVQAPPSSVAAASGGPGATGTVAASASVSTATTMQPSERLSSTAQVMIQVFHWRLSFANKFRFYR